MSTLADSRRQVLERVHDATRAATRNSAPGVEPAPPADSAIARDYIRRGSMSAEAKLERMTERLREYDAEVVECMPEGLVAAIHAQLAASGRRTFVAPVGVPQEWLAPGYGWMIDGGFAADEIERADGVVTACFCGVAESGTIVLHHGPMEGRRVITLLPDWHLCVLRASQVVETLPEYFDRCQGSGIRGQKTGNEGTREQGSEEAGTEGPGTREQGSKGARERGAENLPRLVTWISGPSATADIEMTRIKGVHGPRFLNVVLVRD